MNHKAVTTRSRGTLRLTPAGVNDFPLPISGFGVCPGQPSCVPACRTPGALDASACREAAPPPSVDDGLVTAHTDARHWPMSPWRFVLALGVVSLLADMVYEGARSIIGPYLATLGASAAVVGIVAGAGEFIGYGLRVVTGYAVGRTGRYWTWTILGYALTVLSVPAIGTTGLIAPALVLYGTERLGKAVRSPAKDTLLSFASTGTGRGRAFGVHQTLDQTGALLGPLLLAAVLSWREGDYRLSFGVLLVPGVLAIAVLLWLRSRVPDPRDYET